MASKRTTGPVFINSSMLQPPVVDDGTMSRQPSPLPGTLMGPYYDDRRTFYGYQDYCYGYYGDYGGHCANYTIQMKPVASDTPSELVLMTWDEFRQAAEEAAPDAAKQGIPLAFELASFTQVVKEMGFAGRAATKVANGRTYIILSGREGAGKILTGTRYTPTNAKILKVGIGKTGVVKSAAKGFIITIVVVAAVDILEAVLSDDEMLRKQLGFTLIADLSKAALVTLAATVAAVAVGALTSVAWVPVAAAIVVGIAIGWALDELFPTEELVKSMQRFVDDIGDSITESVQEIGRLYRDLTRPRGPFWILHQGPSR